MIKYLSFDLQGTLSDAKFSDNFWLELLPREYSRKNNIGTEEAKSILKDKFKQIGKYNILYYDDSYWAKKLKFNTLELLSTSNISPQLNVELINYIKTINMPKIILSTTTDLFIKYELGDKLDLFDKTYSCVDYFKTGGKTEDVFINLANELKVGTNEILHIGDNFEMDVDNSRKAGVNAILFNGNINELVKEVKKYLEV